MSTNTDPFANPKYSREELRAMAKEFLARRAVGGAADKMNSDLVQMNLLVRTGISPQHQLELILEMAK